MRTQVRMVLPFLPTLAPFVNLAVDTFPDKRGQLTVSILPFSQKLNKNFEETQFTSAVILERWAEYKKK